jgi:hypothetical protein
MCLTKYHAMKTHNSMEQRVLLEKLSVTQLVKKFPPFMNLALDYGLDDQGFESHQGLGSFLLTTASRPALGPIQPLIQWVPGALSLGVKSLGREADHSHPSSAEVKE